LVVGCFALFLLPKGNSRGGFYANGAWNTESVRTQFNIRIKEANGNAFDDGVITFCGAT
jgi:hypothetical protein